MLAVTPESRRVRIVSAIGWDGPIGCDNETGDLVPFGDGWLPVLDDPATEGIIDKWLRDKARFLGVCRSEAMFERPGTTEAVYADTQDLSDAVWACAWGRLPRHFGLSRINAKIATLLGVDVDAYREPASGE